MKKHNVTKIIVGLFTLLLLSGCSEPDVNNLEKNVKTENQESWNISLPFDEKGLLLSDLNDENQLNKSFELLLSEIDNIEKDGTIIYNLKIDDSLIYLTRFEIYDSNEKLIQSGGINKLQKIGEPYTGLTARSCPSGYRTIGGCGTYDSDRDSCVGRLASSYFSSNLTMIGRCAEVRITVGALDVNVCGRKC